jgi:hypothetical protein
MGAVNMSIPWIVDSNIWVVMQPQIGGTPTFGLLAALRQARDLYLRNLPILALRWLDTDERLGLSEICELWDVYGIT